MKIRPKHVLIATAVVPYVALGWLMGLALLGAAVARIARRFRRTRSALAPTATCPWCHEEVPQYGAYGCGSCRARTLGWAWRCGACSAWAGHIECVHCGMSVLNPLLGSR